ncbi:MAG: OmpA family protein [Deltaproteobacteria bacterium]|nr:OmpA family protein [Deltaproteobacteria bacterium]
MKILFYLFLLFTLITFSACSSSSGNGDGDGTVTDEDMALGDRYGEGNIPKASDGGMFEDVHFGHDSITISASGQEIIKAVAKFLKSNPEVQAELEGHCDKRGTSEYNMALGERRSKAVATMLVSFGANAKQLSTISYGEEIPLDAADSDAAFAKNRRVHFTLYKKQAK